MTKKATRSKKEKPIVHKLMLYLVTTLDDKVGFYVAREMTKATGWQAATQSFGANNVKKVETPPCNYNLLEGEKAPDA